MDPVLDGTSTPLGSTRGGGSAAVPVPAIATLDFACQLHTVDRLDEVMGAMDPKTKGAWVVHHMHKVDAVTTASEFENIYTVGKGGLLLSAIARSDATTFTMDEVKTFAKASGIKGIELPGILEHLEQRRLVVRDGDRIESLGLSTAAVLSHTGKSFDAVGPSGVEKSVIELSEKVSARPMPKKRALEEIGDEHKLPKAQLVDLARQIEEIGFVDAAPTDDGDALYFNGHLFRRENADKITRVLASLSAEENRKVAEAEALLTTRACVPLPEMQKILGDSLFAKLHHIGMFDVSGVHNATENVKFVTRPSAFGKFGDPFTDDALDLAKCFVACLTYGMTRSGAGRGRITWVRALLRKLIAGDEVGPATAIGEDYAALELKGVIKTTPWGDGRFRMKLLKRDVGELALSVITEGEAADATLLGAAVNRYSGPEVQRIARKKQNAPSKKELRDLLTAIRSGGG